MTNDLIFSVLPREGKVPVEKDQLKVKKVEKDAQLRALNDEEKQLNAEEREAREKYQEKPPQEKSDKGHDDSALEQEQDGIEIDEHGRKHLDIYI